MASSSGTASPARVLVTDDDPANRDLSCRRLMRLGYQPVPSEDGSRLFGLLSEAPSDVVLLDMLMPGPDGVEVLTLMKSDPAFRGIPVVADFGEIGHAFRKVFGHPFRSHFGHFPERSDARREV